MVFEMGDQGEKKFRRTACELLSAVLLWGLMVHPTFAQESDLAKRQSGVAKRYQHLEELLIRLADVEATENPERAALLRRAARQSRDQFVLDKIQSASESLASRQFQSAVENQAAANEGLQAILKLLLSEDRSKRIRDEKERVARLVKDLKRIERAQRSTRARAENGAELKEVQEEQKSIADRGEELNEKLSDQNEDLADPQKDPSDKAGSADQQKDPSDQSKPSESKPSESKPSESKPSESKPSDAKPSDAKAKRRETQRS